VLDISRIQAVIFDVDGTLYDQSSLHRRIALRMLAVYGTKPVRGLHVVRVIQAYRQAHEALRDRAFSAEIQLATAAHESDCSVSEVRVLVDQWVHHAALELLAGCVFPGVIGLLETLDERGIKCGVFSDYPAEKKLEAMQLRRFFTNVVCGQEVGWLKPNPHGMVALVAKMGVSPTRALYVGDRNIDQQAAARAGMESVLIKNGTTYSDLRQRFSACKR
jgi:HAD superfamily hydrolase (TIGR01509 family)